jgi:predicted lipoprotein with Yx(FWY)xxD motif
MALLRSTVTPVTHDVLSSNEIKTGGMNMRHRKIAIAAITIAAAAGVSGIAAAATSGTSTTASSTTSASQATIHTQNAMVGGKTETILVDTQGLPLYYYKPDTATKSFVSGELASLWPPLDSTSPTITGTSGKVSVTHDSNGAQVAYNGHFLYTFVDDSAGHVSGQGVQDFFVATPGLAVIGSSSSAPAPIPTSGSGTGYGY